MKILCIGYRDWALAIYDGVDFTGHDVKVVRSKDEYSHEICHSLTPDLVLYYGWSDLIPADITENYKCLMLHPSPLPFYRGGSPLQNQIIRGETISAVSIFRIDGGIDTGDILAQEELSLTDTLDDIFQRIVEVGIRMTESILAGDFTIQRQVGHEGSSFRRLTPAMSEIKINELEGKSAMHLFNKIRMLQTPYPLPFFTTTGGRKIYIKLVPESEL